MHTCRDTHPATPAAPRRLLSALRDTRLPVAGVSRLKRRPSKSHARYPRWRRTRDVCVLPPPHLVRHQRWRERTTAAYNADEPIFPRPHRESYSAALAPATGLDGWKGRGARGLAQVSGCAQRCPQQGVSANSSCGMANGDAFGTVSFMPHHPPGKRAADRADRADRTGPPATLARIREKLVLPIRRRQGACVFGSREPAVN